MGMGKLCWMYRWNLQYPTGNACYSHASDINIDAFNVQEYLADMQVKRVYDMSTVRYYTNIKWILKLNNINARMFIFILEFYNEITNSKMIYCVSMTF